MNSLPYKLIRIRNTHKYLRSSRALCHSSSKSEKQNFCRVYSNYENQDVRLESQKLFTFSQVQEEINDKWNSGGTNSYYVPLYSVLGFIPIFIIVSIVGIKIVYCKADVKTKNDLENEEPAPKKEEKNIPSNNSIKKEKNASSESKNDTSESQKGANATTAAGVTESNQNLIPLPRTTRLNSYKNLSLKEAADLARTHICKLQNETGAPGISLAVSVNGRVVWSEGIGYSDMENGMKMSSSTVMRIASISKSLTSVAIGQLIEQGKLDLDAPVQKYVPSFPEKTFNGEKVVLTTRHLLTHSSGIRHYKLKDEIEKGKKDDSSDSNEMHQSDFEDLSVDEKRKRIRKMLAEKIMKPMIPKEPDEFDLCEYYIKEDFKNVQESLKLFQDDDLLFKPGEYYYYSSHAFTLVSAVIEKASGESFTTYMKNLFEALNMNSTFLDENDPIIYLRGRYYMRDHLGRLKNAPYVSNSYKWAGGGFISTVRDLSNFGNALLYSYQNIKDEGPKGFLKSSTVRSLWSPSPVCPKHKIGKSCGLGWFIHKGVPDKRAFAQNRKTCYYHTGAAVGASSCVLIMPSIDPYENMSEGSTSGEAREENIAEDLPQGIVVTIITNLQNTSLYELALQIAMIFNRVPNDPKILASMTGILKRNIYYLDKL